MRRGGLRCQSRSIAAAGGSWMRLRGVRSLSSTTTASIRASRRRVPDDLNDSNDGDDANAVITVRDAVACGEESARPSSDVVVIDGELSDATVLDTEPLDVPSDAAPHLSFESTAGLAQRLASIERLSIASVAVRDTARALGVSPAAAERAFLRQHLQATRPGAAENPTTAGAAAGALTVAQRTRLEQRTPDGVARSVSDGIRVLHARDDARLYKTPVQQQWEDYMTLRPTLSTVESIVDDQVGRARRSGSFNNLPGRGKPLKFLEEDIHMNPFVSDTEVIMNNMVRSQGHTLGFAETGKDIDKDLALLRSELRALWDECFRDTVTTTATSPSASAKTPPEAPSLSSSQKTSTTTASSWTGALTSWLTGPSQPAPPRQRPTEPDSMRRTNERPEAHWHRRAMTRAQLHLGDINRKIRDYNLSLPSGVPQRLKISAEDEVRRCDEERRELHFK